MEAKHHNAVTKKKKKNCAKLIKNKGRLKIMNQWLFSKGSSRQPVVIDLDENYIWNYTGIKCTNNLYAS